MYYDMIDYTATYTDHYQLTMSQVYFLKDQKDSQAVFAIISEKLSVMGVHIIISNEINGHF